MEESRVVDFFLHAKNINGNNVSQFGSCDEILNSQIISKGLGIREDLRDIVHQILEALFPQIRIHKGLFDLAKPDLSLFGSLPAIRILVEEFFLKRDDLLDGREDVQGVLALKFRNDILHGGN